MLQVWHETLGLYTEVGAVMYNMPRFSRVKLTLLVFAGSAHVYSRRYEMDTQAVFPRGKLMMVARVAHGFPSVSHFH